MKGTVRWFEPRKGYGFIEPEDGSGDVFVHYGRMATGTDNPIPGTAIITTALEPGDKVQFEVADAPHGRQATQVRRVVP
jgi:CspA family cold shock protein